MKKGELPKLEMYVRVGNPIVVPVELPRDA
jgi:hypothetical protein